MGMPTWWGERRYGIYLDSSLASVPAWSPIGSSAERYRSYLGEAGAGGRDGDRAGDRGGNRDGHDTVAEPLVEVLAHHRSRWGHLDTYDDFAPLLTFDEFDAESWAEFALRCGARYAALTARHHDGWCWWDAPGASRTMVDMGPRRNVLAEFAAACERNDLVLGAFYSLDDGASLDEDTAIVDEVAAAQACDLIDRFGVELLFSNVDRPVAERLTERGAHASRTFTDRLGGISDDVVLDGAIGQLIGADPAHHIASFAYEPPDQIVTEHAWQLCRPVGSSLCHNRTERDAHLLSAVDIVTTLTEVVAKGGNLLLGIGASADGSISGPGRAPLIGAADWIRGHDHLLQGARPWSQWGDTEAHYWTRDKALYVADVAGRGRFGLLGSGDQVVERITRASPGDRNDAAAREELPFDQDEAGVRLVARRPVRRPAREFPTVYRVEMSRREQAGELFDPAPPPTVALAGLLEGAERGSIVQLGDARYHGPARVPPGVTLRGLGPERTTITTHDGRVTVDADARLEHLSLKHLSLERHSLERLELPDAPESAQPGDDVAYDPTAVQLSFTGALATVLGCAIDGLVTVAANDVTIRATRLRRLRADDVHRLRLSHCGFEGDRWTTAVEIFGGGDNEIDSCEFAGYRRAIRVVEASGIEIAGNHIESHHCGVHLERADHAHVHRNLVISTMRAVDVDGGTGAVIDGNAVFDGDSGCVVRGGATDCEISGNHWERCRIGVLGWNAGEIHEFDDHAVDLDEPEHVFTTGP
jgi:alpha-L-fucosidase